MILVSFGLWFVVVFGIRIALLGNPLYRMVVSSDPGFLGGIEAVLSGEKREASESEARFIRAVAHHTLLQLAVFFLELVLLVHLWWIKVFPVLAFSLFLKDLLAVSLGIFLAFRERERGVITTLLRVPRWALVSERVSAALSAVGAFFLFLVVNDLFFL